MAEDSVATPTKTQESEIKDLREQFGPQCRVISDVGDFKNVVIIRPSNVDITIKFQLTANYPTEKPNVIMRSESFDPESFPQLQDKVNNILLKNASVSIIDLIVQAVLIILKDNGLDNPSGSAVSKMSENSKATKKKAKKDKSKKPIEEVETVEKKSSMKTADDVIKRIQWDENLSKEFFSVGYIDRFKGIMETCFTAFSWEDIASADYSVLAIPKHRIQYFKYKEVKVWDRDGRLDNIFGSTGGGVTIHDVIDNYEEYYAQELEKQKNSTTVRPVNYDESDSEDDIEIDLGNDVDGYNPHWGNKLRPNHFLCVRITDPEILEGVEAMQDGILESEPRYASCCIPPTALHVTLCMLGLDTMEQVSNACQILEEAQPELAELASKYMELRLEGVDNFFDRVIYAKVSYEEEVSQFIDHLKVLLNEAGVNIRDNYEFVPHMTIMKTTRPIAKEMGTMKVRRNIYEWFNDMKFGNQKIEEVFLCEISNERSKDGFYRTPTSISLIQEH